MTHLVYLLEFDREKLPNKYVGSKSNATFDGEKIIGKRGVYYGSSRDPEMSALLQETNPRVHILGEFSSYQEALEFERSEHIRLDVVANAEFFNKIVANESNYANPEYATYRHSTTGKRVRLRRDHPLVLDGTYVGVTKGAVLSEEQRRKRGRSGEDNYFFGRSHDEATKALLSTKKLARGDARTPDQVAAWVENVAKRKKSIEHRSKIGRKGLVMLQNKETLEILRISKEEASALDPALWANPRKLKPEALHACATCGKLARKSTLARYHGETKCN